MTAVLAFTGAGVAPRASADPAADLTSALDRAIEARVAQMGIPGAIVSLSIPGEIDYCTGGRRRRYRSRESPC